MSQLESQWTALCQCSRLFFWISYSRKHLSHAEGSSFSGHKGTWELPGYLLYRKGIGNFLGSRTMFLITMQAIPPLVKLYESDALIPFYRWRFWDTELLNFLSPTTKLVRMETLFNPGQFAWRICALVTWQCWLLLTLFTNNICKTRGIWEGEAGMKNIWIIQMKLITPFDPGFSSSSQTSAFDLQIFTRIMILTGLQMFQTLRKNWMGCCWKCYYTKHSFQSSELSR